HEVAARDGLVISTGGGAIENTDNVVDLALSGMAICLQASLEKVLERIGTDPNRPNAARAEELYVKRKPLYDDLKYQVDTTELTPEEAGDQILELVREPG
ncbi:MAG: shikimate kinase, partial [Verrucomicrobiota bacterium]